MEWAEYGMGRIMNMEWAEYGMGRKLNCRNWNVQKMEWATASQNRFE